MVIPHDGGKCGRFIIDSIKLVSMRASPARVNSYKIYLLYSELHSRLAEFISNINATACGHSMQIVWSLKMVKQVFQLLHIYWPRNIQWLFPCRQRQSHIISINLWLSQDDRQQAYVICDPVTETFTCLVVLVTQVKRERERRQVLARTPACLIRKSSHGRKRKREEEATATGILATLKRRRTDIKIHTRVELYNCKSLVKFTEA